MTVSFICLLNQLIGFGVLHSLCFKLLFKDYQSWNKSNFIYMYVRTPKAEFILVLRKKKKANYCSLLLLASQGCLVVEVTLS